ncbi:MAG TPA: tetratricopeptide repeat protein [Chitinivibrionales bacterium]|nr:tetratricopeptide repeat protein [Chitinivibrionales bacterium]
MPRKTRVAPAILIFALAAVFPSFALTKIAVFPLVNKTQDKVYDWISALVPEYFSRHMLNCAELQALSPVFLFSADSTAWTMDSDSLLKEHRARWGWDAACGGTFTVSSGRIFCELRTMTVRGDTPVKTVVSQIASIDSAVPLCAGLFAKFAAAIGYALTKADDQALRRALSQSSGAYATYCAGYWFELRGNTAAALTSYARAAEMDPSFGHALFRMARLSRISGDITAARLLFHKAVALSGDAPEVTAAAANFLEDYDLPDKALAFVNKNQPALERSADGMMALGKSYLISGDLQRAIALLVRSVASGPADLEPEFALGKAYLAAGDFTSACDVFNRLVKYRPDCTRYDALLGAAYRNTGRLMEAVHVLEYSAKGHPDDVPVLVNLAQAYLELSWYEKARQLLLHAQELDPDLPDITVNLGVLAWYTGKPDEASRLFEKAARMGTNMQSALNDEANVLLLSGTAGPALGKYRKADRIGAKNGAVLCNLGNTCIALGRLGDAASAFEAALALAPARIDILEKLASIAVMRKKNADAVGYYRRILEQDSRDQDALVKMAELMAGLGQFKEAVEPVEAYLAEMPGEKKIMLLQADLYRQMGWYEVAVVKYQGVTHDFPNDADGYMGLGKSMFDVIQYKNGTNFERTLEVLRTALRLAPGSWEPEYIMGLIYLDYDRHPDQARGMLQSALSKTKDPETVRKISELIEKAGK